MNYIVKERVRELLCFSRNIRVYIHGLPHRKLLCVLLLLKKFFLVVSLCD
jgi:hypothetical protein